MEGATIQPTEDGPYEVTGEFTVVDHNGKAYKKRKKVFPLPLRWVSHEALLRRHSRSQRFQGRLGSQVTEPRSSAMRFDSTVYYHFGEGISLGQAHR